MVFAAISACGEAGADDHFSVTKNQERNDVSVMMDITDRVEPKHCLAFGRIQLCVDGKYWILAMRHGDDDDNDGDDNDDDGDDDGDDNNRNDDDEDDGKDIRKGYLVTSLLGS